MFAGASIVYGDDRSLESETANTPLSGSEGGVQASMAVNMDT